MSLLGLPGAAHAEFSLSFLRRVVQSLLDTADGKSSAKDAFLPRPVIDKHLFREGMGWQMFAKSVSNVDGDEEVVLRITVGRKNIPDPKILWWLPTPIGVRLKGFQGWRREVSEGGRTYERLMGQYKRGQTLLEVIVRADRVGSPRETLVKYFNLLYSNAKKNGVFADPNEGEDVIGTWTGPMRNSKGGSATTTLVITSSIAGSLRGAFHDGWTIENGQRKGNLLTWKHSGIGKCRDYQVSMTLTKEDKAELKYSVNDRCGKPKKYTGSARLARVK